MKISVENFKAINSLIDFDLEPIVVLSGTNSGGKTSLIQLIMLLKQTLESVVSNAPLILNKPYISLGKFKDIIFNRNTSNKLTIGLYLDKKEIRRYRLILKKIAKEDAEGLSINMEFSFSSNKIYIQTFYVAWAFKEFTLWIDFTRIRSNKYKLSTNSIAFFTDEFNQLRKSYYDKEIIQFREYETKVEFIKMFPYFFRISNGLESISPLGNEYILLLLNQIFSSISYIGPLRDEPHSYYFNDDDSQLKIGNKGEFAAHILAQNAKNEYAYYKIKEFTDKGIIYDQTEESLEKAVKYWICDVFGMANNIKAIKLQNEEMYRIEVTNNFGIKTPITQVGFGISQIFPIVVEGLRAKRGSTLILEQPEIHLHPKVQSLLFDFLYSLTLQGKRVIIETHSDHFITRLRRRVAEDMENKVVQQINLTFIEREGNINNYKKLDLSEIGTLSYWPKDFFDQADEEVRAIVKAQGRKRRQVYEEVKKQ